MYTRDIKQWVFSLHEEDLILAKNVYEKHFTQMKEATFYQLLARLNEEKFIGKIAKGLYYKPKKDNYDSLPSNDKLINFFTNKSKNGMIVGSYMLQKHGIIENATGNYEIYTNVIEIKTRRFISNLEVENVDIDYKNSNLVETIEILELIEIIDNFEEVNITSIRTMLEEYATHYNEDNLFKILFAHSYKKRNIYTLKMILDRFGVTNNLGRQLNTASKYAVPSKIIDALN